MRLSKKPQNEILRIDFPNCINQEFPEVFPAAWSSTEILTKVIKESDFSILERNSPGLKGFDWTAYLRCSVVRVVRVLRALNTHVSKPAKVLDYGSYFGNFALAARSLGHRVDVADFYKSYGDAFTASLQLMRERDIGAIDLDDLGPDMLSVEAESYDAVLCLGVIEHIPHTPKPMLQTINRLLKPGGTLILDTPNLAYIYKRQQLARGESVYAPVQSQFHAEVPFTGHHREYTPSEIRWMLQQVGQEVLSLETFSYSLYSLSLLQGADLENYRIMQEDPGCRELIFTVSRKSDQPYANPSS
jgi:2-polyprenyl-3-methyl-5-hydroxy-6-metoxy-1,4-benzoquinol methylase